LSGNGGDDGARVVVSHFRAKPGSEEAIEALMAAHATDTHTEPGVRTFAMHRDADDPGHFVVIEVYDGQADLEFHRTTPHYARTMAQLPELIDGRPDSTPLDRVPLGDPAKGNV
jgi:quinol monooxygenase YgiN